MLEISNPNISDDRQIVANASLFLVERLRGIGILISSSRYWGTGPMVLLVA